MNRILANVAASDWAVPFIAPDGCIRIGQWLLHESSAEVDTLLAWGNIVHNRAEQSSLAASQVSTSTNGVSGDLQTNVEVRQAERQKTGKNRFRRMFRGSEDYEHFANFIRTQSRYVLDGWQQDFVNTIVETSKKRTTTLPANQILWRAALGYENLDGVHPHEVFFLHDIKPHKVERMKPLRDRAHEGRINPRGIPCLYMATNDVTAMMEVRPWAGSVLTISQLVLLKEATLVDCTQAAEFDLDEPMTQQKLESNNWHVLNEAFSLPVFQSEDVADYAPTQYIAEAFRAAKYDGVVYESKVGNGKNIAIFDPGIAEIVNRRLRQANKPSFSFTQVGSVTFEEKYQEVLPAPESAAPNEGDD